MEHRRRDNGGPLRGARRRAGRPRAEARTVRVGAIEPARPHAGTAGQAHDLCVARHAAQPGSRRPGLRGVPGGIRKQDHRDLGTLLPQHDEQEHHRATHLHRAGDYACELINMRSGDIFMGAFNAKQVMYNHFGYRSPIANLYNAGSAGHPGGAISGGSGYIMASIIARDRGLKLWWKPWDARVALEAMPQAA